MWGLDVLGQLPGDKLGPPVPSGPTAGDWSLAISKGPGALKKGLQQQIGQDKTLLGLLLKQDSAAHLTFNGLGRSTR